MGQVVQGGQYNILPIMFCEQGLRIPEICCSNDRQSTTYNRSGESWATENPGRPGKSVNGHVLRVPARRGEDARDCIVVLLPSPVFTAAVRENSLR